MMDGLEQRGVIAEEIRVQRGKLLVVCSKARDTTSLLADFNASKNTKEGQMRRNKEKIIELGDAMKKLILEDTEKEAAPQKTPRKEQRQGTSGEAQTTATGRSQTPPTPCA